MTSDGRREMAVGFRRIILAWPLWWVVAGGWWGLVEGGSEELEELEEEKAMRVDGVERRGLL